MTFADRHDAGQRLAEALHSYKPQQPVILALPRGGVPVAAEVAKVLGAPLDLLIVRKIGVPSFPELAMGAVVDGDAPIVVRNEDVIQWVSRTQFRPCCGYAVIVASASTSVSSCRSAACVHTASNRR